MYVLTVRRPDGIVLRRHTPDRDRLGDIAAREQARGSEIIDVEFPDED